LNERSINRGEKMNFIDYRDWKYLFNSQQALEDFLAVFTSTEQQKEQKTNER
jgi:hypothetical protein